MFKAVRFAELNATRAFPNNPDHPPVPCGGCAPMPVDAGKSNVHCGTAYMFIRSKAVYDIVMFFLCSYCFSHMSCEGLACDKIRLALCMSSCFASRVRWEVDQHPRMAAMLHAQEFYLCKTWLGMFGGKTPKATKLWAAQETEH